MKERYDDLVVNRLNELYKIYEQFIWKRKDRRLIVLFQENMTISFYLYEGKEVVDELDISFDEKESSLFRIIALKLFANLLGNVYIHNEENIYYNKKHKDYLRVIVCDEELKKIISKLVSNQEKEIINTNNSVIKENIPVLKRKYSKEFIGQLDKRVNLSSLMLRGF